MFKKIFFIAVCIGFYANAQDHRIPLDTTVVTTNTVTIKGKKVPSGFQFIAFFNHDFFGMN